ncbi:HK97 family phage prohead protease [Mycobacterium camsae]|uniref:HK97 family phage prohead protease n=1 Tax=Mycobacterium gordonae TaxID=1778 RepID=UPI00197E8F5F|nr:HK97 family phage prohead protease [Mycobacterium gordonae]
MHRKTVPIEGIKTAGLEEGTFEGFASTFGNIDYQGDRVMPGAFAKSIASGRTVPLLWMHRTEDPRAFVGEVVEASETAEGLKILGRFDLDTDEGAAAYRQVKARRIGALSIGYQIKTATKGSDGANELRDLDLVEVSVVTRGANDRALITAAKSGDTRESLRETVARAQLHAKDNTVSFYEPTDPTNEFDRALMKVGARESVKAAQGNRWSTERDEHLTKAREICELAKELDRDLTTEEADQVKKHLDGAEAATKAMAEASKSAALLAQLDAMARDTEESGGGSASGGDQHLAMTGRHAKTLAQSVVKAMPHNGTKALASGVQTTSTLLLPNVVETGRPAASLLDILPVRIVPPSYSFLRQSARTNNAAPVAAGGLKPTSVVSVTSVDNRLRVVAHLSEQIPRYLLSDNTDLERFVADELLWGLRKAIEAEVISGDGTGEHFTGILNTSGVVVQAFATNALTSVRKALTTLDANGYEAGAIALSAADWEAIELLEVTSGATDVRGVPIDPVARRLWGVPVVLNQGLGSKTGLVLGKGAVTIDHDGAVDVAWSENIADDFTKNFVRCRVEGRFGVSVNQPAAVVKVGTAA